MGKIIAIMSGKGGVGKTTLTAYIGAALNRRGHRVLITDADFGMRDLDLVLGKENDIFFDAVDIWRERCDTDNAIIPLCAGFDFLPATQSRRWEDVGRKGYGKLIKRLAKEYDYVIIDAPAGIGRGNEAIFRVAEQLLLVAEPMWVSLRAVERVMQLCHEERLFNYGLVLNNVGRSEAAVPVEEALQSIQVENIATILPHSLNILTWSQEGVLHEKCDPAMDAMMEPLLAYIESDTAWLEETVLARWEALGCSERAARDRSVFSDNSELSNDGENIERNNKTVVIESDIHTVNGQHEIDTKAAISDTVTEIKEQEEESPKKSSFGALLKRRFTSFWTRGGRLR